MSFSERMGFKEPKEIQKERMDEDLRWGIWNILENCMVLIEDDYVGNPALKRAYKEFFRRPLNEIIDTNFVRLTGHDNNIKNAIFEKYKELGWYEVYDFIEYCYLNESDQYKSNLTYEINEVLKQENSFYRIIEGQVAPITNEYEKAEIEQAIKKTEMVALHSADEHLRTALKYLSDRENPDYRNSIKESISAVEAVANAITGSSGTSLGKALSQMEESITIHPALNKGFQKIYGYTSDSDGIRHALTEEPNCDFEDAQYMLVSCSAFINYLIKKAEKAGKF